MLRRARFGRSSEKLDQAIEQLELLIGEHEEGEAENPGSSRSGRAGQLGGSGQAPQSWRSPAAA